MNLATARFLKRAREVGVRKVAGSSKLQLVMQFLSESLLITLTAAFLCVFLIYIFLPLFNEIAQKQIPFSILFQTNLILLFPGVVLFTGILGGSYPAFYLSSFKPINVLKGRMASKRGKPMLRKALVVTQFIISLALLTSTLIAYRQLEFLSNKNLGFDREHVVLVNMRDPGLREKFQPLKNELLTIPEVVYVSTASNAPGNNMPRMRLGVETNDGNIEEDKTVEFYFADFDFIQTLGMEIIEGRNLDEQFSSDTAFSVLVNEAMVSQMNWDHPLGKKVKLPVFGQDSTVTKEVVGVIKDFHQKSLYDHIEPLLVQYANSSFVLYVKIDGNDISNTLQKLENSWRSIHPDRPFDFSFLDQDFAANYDEDKRRGKIFAVFSVLSIVIACLGLLGLVAFTTEERNKDIAIRKINGASTPNLVILLSKDFLMLVLLGAIIALPVTWYYMDNWLNNFAYKIILLNELGLALKATILLIIATMLTVGYHTIRTATKNPVRYLRSD
jgi:putative ABC transport system permease protein